MVLPYAALWCPLQLLWHGRTAPAHPPKALPKLLGFRCIEVPCSCSPASPSSPSTFQPFPDASQKQKHLAPVRGCVGCVCVLVCTCTVSCLRSFCANTHALQDLWTRVWVPLSTAVRFRQACVPPTPLPPPPYAVLCCSSH